MTQPTLFDLGPEAPLGLPPGTGPRSACHGLPTELLPTNLIRCPECRRTWTQARNPL